MPSPDIQIDADRVEHLLLELAGYGAVGETGVARAVYTPEWVGASDCVMRWCREAGLNTRMDAVGNVWGRAEGTEQGPSIVSGSHIDSQLPGGRYDGALGIIAAFVAVEALVRQFGRPRRTLEVLSLCEEETSRFARAGFWGSRAITGRIAPGDADALLDRDGISASDAMRAVGLDPDRIPEAQRNDIESYIELHIEQGPILEAMDRPVAAVTAITGIRHYQVTLRGEANHAGAFPMDLRRDPVAGFAEIATGLIGTAEEIGRPAVTTVGWLRSVPHAAAVIPAEVTFTIDVRHPVPEEREKLHQQHEQLMAAVAERRGLEVEWSQLVDHPPCPSDPALLAAINTAAKQMGVPQVEMASGASHDGQQMSLIARTAMIFVRSKDGRSHTPEEFSSIPDIVAGVRVLAATLYQIAY